MSSSPRVALVLGAGGSVGHSFHVGVLSALADELGWDARAADLVIGTSAGSVVGAGLRAGLAPADMRARALGRPLSPEGSRLVAVGEEAIARVTRSAGEDEDGDAATSFRRHGRFRHSTQPRACPLPQVVIQWGAHTSPTVSGRVARRWARRPSRTGCRSPVRESSTCG